MKTKLKPFEGYAKLNSGQKTNHSDTQSSQNMCLQRSKIGACIFFLADSTQNLPLCSSLVIKIHNSLAVRRSVSEVMKLTFVFFSGLL